MNLQERLERMLEERRGYVEGHEPGPVAAMEGLLMTCAEGALHAESVNDRDGWLVRLAGLCLYVLHPEDEKLTGSTEVGDNGVPLRRLGHPALPSQVLREAGIAHAFTGLGMPGVHKNPGMLIGPPDSGRPQGEPLPAPRDCDEVHVRDEDTVYRRGDGRWRRKPRPDRG